MANTYPGNKQGQQNGQPDPFQMFGQQARVQPSTPAAPQLDPFTGMVKKQASAGQVSLADAQSMLDPSQWGQIQKDVEGAQRVPGLDWRNILTEGKNAQQNAVTGAKNSVKQGKDAAVQAAAQFVPEWRKRVDEVETGFNQTLQTYKSISDKVLKDFSDTSALQASQNVQGLMQSANKQVTDLDGIPGLPEEQKGLMKQRILMSAKSAAGQTLSQFQVNFNNQKAQLGQQFADTWGQMSTHAGEVMASMKGQLSTLESGVAGKVGEWEMASAAQIAELEKLSGEIEAGYAANLIGLGQYWNMIDLQVAGLATPGVAA